MDDDRPCFVIKTPKDNLYDPLTTDDDINSKCVFPIRAMEIKQNINFEPCPRLEKNDKNVMIAVTQNTFKSIGM